MNTDHIKKLLFEVGAALDRAKTLAEFEALEAKYRALKNQWNRKTGNAILWEVAI